MTPTGEDPIRQAIQKTMDQFFNGYIKATVHNEPNYLSAYLTPDCVRTISPESFLEAVGAPLDIAFSNEAYQAQFTKEMPVVTSITLDKVYNVSIDAAAKTASAMNVYTMEWVDGGKIKLEFAWFFHFTNDGTRVARVHEFLDTTASLKFGERNLELLAKREAGA